MENLSRQFIEFALQSGVLKFGDFTMKSGRRSPYFFNSGLFSRGSTLGRLSRFYAQALLAARVAGRVEFDMLFGPAYKGITLAAGTAMALADFGVDVPFSFNRKEAKDHGEGGLIVGAELAGRVLIVDDVITDGAAKRESVELIRAHGATPCGVLIALDRHERTGADEALSSLSAVAAFERTFGIPVVAVAGLRDLLEFIDSDAPAAAALRPHRQAMLEYRTRYGA
jgi:orotate phosphoribosyltransferase